MRDVAENLLLFKVEAQSDAGMLQIVVARARVRFVGTEQRGSHKNSRQCSEGKTQNTTVIGAFPIDHSIWLL